MTANFSAQITNTNISFTNKNCGCEETTKPTATQGADGTVAYENEDYLIKVTDTGTVNITNKDTGENYNVWGDPHVAVDGQQAFDFWGKTTITLDDGTKVTIDTTPVEGSDGATMASTVTIVDGQSDYAVQVTGVDSNETGDIVYTETTNAWLMDAMVDDGNMIYENPVGAGFVAVDDCGNIVNVDQQHIDQTDLVKNPEQQEDGSCAPPQPNGELKEAVERFAKLVNVFTGIVAIHLLGTMLRNDDDGGCREGNRNGNRSGGKDVSFSASNTSMDVTFGRGGASMSFQHSTVDLELSRG
jgi:Domain of Unknown Function (DUF1521)